MPFAIQRIIVCGFLILTTAPASLYADDWYTHEHIALSLKQVEDKNPEVRKFAAEYLGNYGRQCLCTEDERKAIIKALKKRLYDPDKFVRYSAAEALARTNVFFKAKLSPTGRKPSRAAEFEAELHNAVLADLRTWLCNKDAFQRHMGAELLAEKDIGAKKEALPVLIEELKDNDKAVNPVKAANALRYFGPEAKGAVSLLIALMRKKGISFRDYYPSSEYEWVLDKIGTPESLATIKPLKIMQGLADAIYWAFIYILAYPIFPLAASLYFAYFIWWSSVQANNGGRIIYRPLVIPMLGWAYAAGAHIFAARKYGLLESTSRRSLSLLLLTTTILGCIPWLVSVWRLWRRKKRQAADLAAHIPETRPVIPERISALKLAIRFLQLVTAFMLVFVVDMMGLHPFSVLSSPGDTPWISAMTDHMYLYSIAYICAPILIVAISVMAQRRHSALLHRLLEIAAPILLGLTMHYLVDNQIDGLLNGHFEFFSNFAANLPAFFTSYLMVGLTVFIQAMLICYPVGVGANRLLIYIARKFIDPPAPAD
ncbi:MAG: HEAT repeat domain-containing protein [Elusimicrobia bacterium]|nr:HEAT repeat domain-containing protein [Elusimicrobiota bacterium]